MGKDNRFLRDQRHVANDYEFLWESLRDGIAQKVYKGDWGQFFGLQCRQEDCILFTTLKKKKQKNHASNPNDSNNNGNGLN